MSKFLFLTAFYVSIYLLIEKREKQNGRSERNTKYIRRYR